ncbi:MAG: TonB-dependent receptor [bacterium]|nr:TonB-dependent receptor [bacterium]
MMHRIVCGFVCLVLLVAGPWIAVAEQPVEATGQEEKKEEKSGAATSLTQKLDADSGISVQTLCTNCNNADLSISGMGNEHVSVSCDGLLVPPGLAQVYLLSVMPATMIDKVDVKKGAGRADLGGSAVGGGIEIERREPEPGFQLNASADAGDFDWRGTKVDLSGKSGAVGGWFAASAGTSDVIDNDEDGFAELPSFDRLTLEGSLSVDMGRNHHLRFGAARYDESQEDGRGAYTAAFAGWDREDVELERDQFDAFYEARLGDGRRLSATGLWSERSQDISETENLGTTFQETYLIDEDQRNASVRFEAPIGQAASIEVGGSYSRSAYEVVDVFGNQNAGRPADAATEERVTETGAYFGSSIRLASNLELSVGVRYVDFDYVDNETRIEWLAYSLPEGNQFLPRAALTWKPVNEWQVRVSAGSGFRAPHPVFEEVCCGRRYRTNRGIDVEESRSYGVEATFQPNPRVRVGSTVFLTEFDELVVKMISQAFDFIPTYQNANVAEARQVSVSLDARVEATPWLELKASISGLEIENRAPGNEIRALVDAFFGPPREEVFVTEDIPYVAESRGSIGIDIRPQRWGATFGISAQYTGEMLIQRMYGESDFANGIFEGFLDPEFFAAPDFWVSNVNFSKAFKAGISIFAGVDNVFDEVQDDIADPTTEYNWGALRGRYVYGGVAYSFKQ